MRQAEGGENGVDHRPHHRFRAFWCQALPAHALGQDQPRQAENEDLADDAVGLNDAGFVAGIALLLILRKRRGFRSRISR